MANGLWAAALACALVLPNGVAPAAEVTAAPVLRSGTPVQLMVLNEVTTKTAKPGDRFVLRVHAPVSQNGAVVIPVGTKAVGEVVDAEKNGILGQSGKLSVRLLHLEWRGQAIALTGTDQDKGKSGAPETVVSVVAIGVLGLLARGNNAKLKAGELVTGFIDGDHGLVGGR